MRRCEVGEAVVTQKGEKGKPNRQRSMRVGIAHENVENASTKVDGADSRKGKGGGSDICGLEIRPGNVVVWSPMV